MTLLLFFFFPYFCCLALCLPFRYEEASALKLQKPGDIWVWVQEGDALVLRCVSASGRHAPRCQR